MNSFCILYTGSLHKIDHIIMSDLHDISTCSETKQDNVELEPEDKEPAKTEETKPETPKQEEVG